MGGMLLVIDDVEVRFRKLEMRPHCCERHESGTKQGSSFSDQVMVCNELNLTDPDDPDPWSICLIG